MEATAIKFSILGENEIKNYSSFEVTSSDATALGGVLDPRFGNNNTTCVYCKKSNKKCIGHFGHLALRQPMFNWAFINYIKKILTCICWKTSKLLVPKTENYSTNAKKRFVQIYQDCIKLEDTPKLIIQGKTGIITLIAEYANNLNLLLPIKESDTTTSKDKYHQIITPEETLQILTNICEEDRHFLGIQNPEKMLIINFPVPPLAIRPSLNSDFIDGASENGLTHKLADIVKFNKKVTLESFKPTKHYNDYLSCLQYHLATYYDNESNLLPRSEIKTGNFTKGIKSNIEGKNGRIRCNLQGKRVDFSARSVITSDPNTKIDQIGVPVKIAMTITFPEIVTVHNISFLTHLVNNGNSTYPGANFIEKNKTTVIDLKFKKNVELQVNWIVHRHLLNEDIILFNRQPTLHKVSLMAHRVYVINNPSLMTFRLNVTATTPYNADFDGDEMNLFSPQSYASSVEINELANIKNYIVSPRDSMPIINLKQDAIIGQYMLNHMNLEFDWKTVMNLLSYTSNINTVNKKNYTGIELLSLISNQDQITYLDDIQSLINAIFMLHTSFTVGLNDAIIPEEINKEIQHVLNLNNEELASSEINTLVSTILMERIDLTNNLKFQIESGAKGKPSNFGMISGCLGQAQTNCKLSYEQNSFIKSSYLKGLTFPEFMYHNMDGRNGMIDTAINTAITGYMQRKTIKAMEDVYVSYDSTVRDESNQIIQFIYGENGYDPNIIFLESIKKEFSESNHDSFKNQIDRLFSPEFTLLFPMERAAYGNHDNYRYKMDQHHKQLLRQTVTQYIESKNMSAQQLDNFIHELSTKFNQAIVQPGEMVGITAAQSLGEPLTQFTLNTFHSTGLSGVTEQKNSIARFSEILGFSKNTKNSTIKLHMKNQRSAEEFMKQKKFISFQDHCESAEIIYTGECDYPWIFKFYMNKKIHPSLLESFHSFLKKQVKSFKTIYENKNIIIHVNSEPESIHTLFDSILQFKSKKNNISLQGSIVLVKNKTLNSLCDLLLANNIYDIDWSSIESNDLYLIYINYGIEATRTTIIEELTKFYEANNTFINYQHISLIADKMTHTGVVKPLNRYGVTQFEPHVLSRASFEKTMEHFIEAAIFEEEDPLKAVSSKISLGKVFNGGTGIVDIIMEDENVNLLTDNNIFDV